MNEIIKEVTPLTRGIIWLIKDETEIKNPHYADIDYILDGLLTANLNISKTMTSQVIVGKNFNHSIYVMVIRELKSKELDSYLSLFKNDLNPENDILVIDEVNGFEKLRPQFGKLGSHLRVVQ